jgi:hypothetical protein
MQESQLMSWTSRVRPPAGTPSLRQVQDAAENLADQAGITPGKTRVVFQTVTDAAIIVSALTATTLAAMHLYKTLFPRHREDQHSPEPASSGRSPPRRRRPHAIAAAGDRGGCEDGGCRSR